MSSTDNQKTASEGNKVVWLVSIFTAITLTLAYNKAANCRDYLNSNAESIWQKFAQQADANASGVTVEVARGTCGYTKDDILNALNTPTQ